MLCWQCGREANRECHCGHAVCDTHCVSKIRGMGLDSGVLCVEHEGEQEAPVVPTIWMNPPSGGDPIEVAYVHEIVVPYMVRGYSQCPAPAGKE